MKEKLKYIIIPVITLASFAVYAYGAYALYYEFDYWPDNLSSILYIALMTIACAFFGFLFTSALSERVNAAKGVAGAVAGGAIFNITFWIINALVPRNENVIVYSFSVLFPLIAAVLLFSFIRRSFKGQKILNIVMAVVFFVVSCGGGFIINSDRIVGAQYTRNITFDSISALDVLITEEEKQYCREWYNDNVLMRSDDAEIPYTFDIGGVSLADDIDNWNQDITPETKEGAIYKGGKTSYIYLSNEDYGIDVTVEATIYEEKATCEWTVYIHNVAEENSEVISDFYALKSSVETGNSEVYYSKGSTNEANDFALGKKNVGMIPAVFDCAEGRSSYTYMPYFNINGTDKSVVLAVGWTGEWETTLSQHGNKTNMCVKQADFNAYLLPDEEVRSPLVSLCFYDTDNALKGFNIFRSWVIDCVSPANLPSTMTMMEVAGPESKNTADQIFDTLDTFDDSVYSDVDYFWMDAGWYDYVDGWYDSVGNWTSDTDRYDNGIIEISDYAKNKNCGLVLWYEPERVYADTKLGRIGAENENWLVFKDDGEFAMWNLAEYEAAKYLAEFVATSLVENGVKVYRQDFNFDISDMWKYADANFYDGRIGICENHYVSNLYKYLDYLRMNIKGLIIDNCASGGRRLDLEMTRRSVPLWRSDYNCSMHDDIYAATQSQTYGLSFWLPMSGTLRYSESEYAARSSIMYGCLETFGTVNSEFFGAYKEQRELMDAYFYPLTSGGYESDEILAMQYSEIDGTSGEALIYKRSDVKEDEFTLKLNGLIPEKKYKIYDYDNPDKTFTMSGKELMESGINISLPDEEKAIIMMFEVVL